MSRELAALGEQPRIEDGGVTWEGDARSLMRANLWLRTASRVLVRVATFRATEFYELEKHARRISWEQYVPRGHAAAFRVTARKSKLYHSDAIAERLITAVSGGNPSRASDANPTTGELEQLFVVRVVRDVFTISADASGTLLHMRGYRQATAKAPLRETLAAALLLAAEWSGDVPLLDPLCGSGTIPIEAAMIARTIAPGLRREFAFMRWRDFDRAAWNDMRAAAERDAKPRTAVPILGSDRDAGAIEAARGNAQRAGVDGDVSWAVRSVSAASPEVGAPGLIATNPPYGKRVSAGQDVRNVYAQLGNLIRAHLGGWRLALYSPEGHLAKQLGLPVKPAFRTTNGGIPVTALIAGS